MSSMLHVADYVAICLMLAISGGVGFYFRLTGGRQKTTLEFLMADKNMTVLPVTFSVLATIMSAIAVLGTPAESYLYGTQMWIKDLFYSLAIFIVAYCILPVYFDNDVKTIYEYLEKRFGKVIRTTASLLYVVQMVLYIPVVIYAPSLALNVLTGLSLWTSVVSVAVVCTFYSTLGGLKAVLWTDLFQGILMFLTLFALIIKGSLDSGGFYNVFQRAEESQRLELFNTSMDLTVRYTFWNSITRGLIGALYYNGTTFTVIQRLMSCGNVKKAQKSLLCSIPLFLTFQSAVCFLGLTMYAYFYTCDPVSNKEVESKDQLVPLFILKLFGEVPGLPGFCVAGILSAALSTMSSVLNSLATATLEDFIIPFMKSRNLKQLSGIVLAKSLALFYGGLCLFLTFVVANVKGLLEAALLLLGIVGGPTFGVFYLGMFTTTGNELGALIGLVAGLVVSGWIGFGTLYNKSKYPPLPLSTAGCSKNVSDIPFGMITYAENFTSTPEVFSITRNFNATSEEERYVFPLYKISYMWLVVIGSFTSAIVGYVVSLVIEFKMPKKEIDPKHLSPLVRRWLCRVPEPFERKEYIKLTHVLNQIEKSSESEEQRSENI